MSQQWDQSRRTTLLGDVPVPDAVECDNEATWKMFLELQSHPSAFPETQTSVHAPLNQDERGVDADSNVTADEVMAEARRYNRVCPIESQWRRLHALLEASGDGTPAPQPLAGTELARTPPLGKRMRLRDQVEWAAQHGGLPEVFRFLRGLSEDQWHHIGR